MISCHGGAIFPGIIDKSTGRSVIAGKKVTGFTTKGEEEEGVLDTIKSWKRPTIEASAADSGATCEFPSVPVHTLDYILLSPGNRRQPSRTLGCFYADRRAYRDGRKPRQCPRHCRSSCGGFQKAVKVGHGITPSSASGYQNQLRSANTILLIVRLLFL